MSNAPRGRRSGGSAARQALRAEASTEIRTFLTRTMAPFEVLSVEPPAGRKAGIKVESVEELVDKLRNEAKVIS